jgi:protein YIPF1/2
MSGYSKMSSSDDELEFAEPASTQSSASGGLKFEAYPSHQAQDNRQQYMLGESPMAAAPAKTTYGIMGNNAIDDSDDNNLLANEDQSDDDAFNLSDDMDLGMGQGIDGTPFKHGNADGNDDDGDDDDDGTGRGNYFETEPMEKDDEDSAAGDDENKTYRPWEIGYYQKYFDVDTMDVAKRLFETVVPRTSFFEVVGDNADLYGTFWVPTTLIFLMAATGNFATYLDKAWDGEGDEWQYDFWYVVIGAASIYAYVLLMPLALWGIFKWRDIDLGFLATLCLFGYSLAVYAPLSVLCVIPSSIVRWILLPIGCVWVCLFLARAFFSIYHTHRKEAMFIMLSVGLINVGLMLAFRLYFFEYSF